MILLHIFLIGWSVFWMKHKGYKEDIASWTIHSALVGINLVGIFQRIL